jgi:alkylation response protein AidB-like acyl-CoA dehydrogenase
MSIAITDEHRALADAASDFLLKRDARGEARALLEAPTEPMPEMWNELVNMGWLGLHLPEAYGGSGYSLQELVVVVEELGRAVAPGPFVPTVIASAALNAAGDDALKAKLLPGLADGSTTGAVAPGRRAGQGAVDRGR